MFVAEALKPNFVQFVGNELVCMSKTTKAELYNVLLALMCHVIPGLPTLMSLETGQASQKSCPSCLVLQKSAVHHSAQYACLTVSLIPFKALQGPVDKLGLLP
jgi:hypothetical protein